MIGTVFVVFVHAILANKADEANLEPELLQCFLSLMSQRRWDIITRYTLYLQNKQQLNTIPLIVSSFRIGMFHEPNFFCFIFGTTKWVYRNKIMLRQKIFHPLLWKILWIQFGLDSNLNKGVIWTRMKLNSDFYIGCS